MWTYKRFTIRAPANTCSLLTDSFAAALPELKSVKEGVLHLYCHTENVGINLNENSDPTVRTDLFAAFKRLGLVLGPILVGNNISIPVKGGRMFFGTWQGIYVDNFGSGGEADFTAILHGEEALPLFHKTVIRPGRGAIDMMSHISTAIQNQQCKSVGETPGLLHVRVLHASATMCLTMKDYMKKLESDLSKFVPDAWSRDLFKHTYEGDDDMPGHCKCAMVGPDFSHPVTLSGAGQKAVDLQLPNDFVFTMCEPRDDWGQGGRNLCFLLEAGGPESMRRDMKAGKSMIDKSLVSAISAEFGDGLKSCKAGVIHVLLLSPNWFATTVKPSSEQMALLARMEPMLASTTVGFTNVLPVADGAIQGNLFLTPHPSSPPSSDTVTIRLTLLQ